MSKTLYVLRHAKSSWKVPRLADRERPLNKRGKRNAPDMGDYLAKKGYLPQLVICSPARRALTTARMLCHATGYPENKIITHEDLYFSGVESIYEIISSLDDNAASAMIVAHNPDLHEFIESLTGNELEKYPTLGLAVISTGAENWSDTSPGQGKLVEFNYPKNLGYY